MADPVSYSPSTSFAGYQATNPSRPLRGPAVDTELANIAASVTSLIDAVRDVRRADGRLPNGIVTPEALSPILTVGFRPRGQWQPERAYIAGDGVFDDGWFYVAREPHESEDEQRPADEPDLWARQFELASALGNMNTGVYDPDQLAINVYDTDNHQDGETNAVYTIAEREKLEGVAEGATNTEEIPLGTVIESMLPSPPSEKYVWADGRAISRTLYSALFERVGTAWGEGNGTTTFNVIDRRGRVGAGRDNMGGTAAGRLTGTTMTPNGNTLGATGGAQTHALTSGQNGPHTHSSGTLSTGSSGGHTHDLTLSVRGNSGTDTQSAKWTAKTLNNLGTATATTESAGPHTHPISGATASSGSGSPHNNVQPTILANYFVKVLP